MNVLEELRKLLAAEQAVESGNPLAIGRAAVDILLDFIPADDLRAHLDAEATKRAETIANAAEGAKFGST